MGTLQDIIINLSLRFKKKFQFEYKKRKSLLWYSFLLIAIIFLIFSSLFVINLLDPFSNFGRIISILVRPLFIVFNNVIAFTLEQFNFYEIYPIEFKGIHLETLLFPVVLLIIILWLSIKHGRLFCNSVCPVGALLGLVSRYSFFKIVVDEDNCNECGECEYVCKANCIKSEDKLIDFDRCVSCFNCFKICPSNGLKYHLSLSRKTESTSLNIDYTKRNFIVQTFIYTLGIAGLSYAQQKIQVYKKNTIPVIRETPISPPGSKGIENFTDCCTACHLCISACPTQVLQPSFLEYGFLGMLQPRMDNNKGYCTHDCTICSEICPSGAIQSIHVEEKKLTQIGKVKFIKENCIVEIQKTECGACAEHCPTKAVRMIPYDKLMIPEVNDEICVGCGACEYACPTIPYKSIYVEGNSIHILAQKPEEQKLQEEIDLKEEFPF
jgi:ferredoxin